MVDLDKVKEVLSNAYIYIPFNCEAMIVTSFQNDGVDGSTDPDDWVLYGTGEESGEEYKVLASEVDLKNDMCYKLQLIEVDI